MMDITEIPDNVTLDFCNGSEAFRVYKNIPDLESAGGLVFC